LLSTIGVLPIAFGVNLDFLMREIVVGAGDAVA
jgi:hypothetical protein